MTELDALKWKLQQNEDAFNRLHKQYIKLLKKQGELEKENQELKQQLRNSVKEYRKNTATIFELEEELKELKQQ